jgi:hypothetical protein
LAPLQPFASYVVSALVDAQAFHLLPNSELGAQNPRDVPREIFVEEGLIDSNQPPRKHSKRDKVIRARTALDAVGRWLDQTPLTSGARSTLVQYEAQKARLLNEIGADSVGVQEASQGVVERLQEAQAMFDEDVDAWTGLTRIQAASESAGGMLRLLQYS